MSNLARLTQPKIREFAKEWFDLLDDHAAPEQYSSLLAGQELKMLFPEGKFVGFDGFKRWYDNAINSFFDEVHTIKEITVISATPEKLELKVIVNWKAITWNPPQPKSQRIDMDAYQSWTLEIEQKTQQLIITAYEVDKIEYAEGSAKL